MRPTPDRMRNRGFTMVEMVVVIVITGILGAAVAVFMRAPIQGFVDTANRGELADEADTTLRRMARDLQSALPNSVRVSGNYLEFIPIKDAGRYRAEVGTGAEDYLDFSSAADSTFDVLGPNVTVASGDFIVVFNVPGNDAYTGTTESRRSAAAPFGSVSNVAFSPGGVAFPFASPGSRFAIVSTAVSYQCDVAGGVIRRYAGYAIQSTQQTSAPAGATSALIAKNVTACGFSYASDRNGLVSISMTITKNGESASLLHQVNVVNTP